MERAVNLGAVRLGSLSDYRRQEKHGDMVADPSEGSKRIDGHIKHFSPSNRHLYPTMDRFFGPGASFTDLTMIGVKVVSPDCLIFSASLSYSEAVHRHWHKVEGYDACYRIDDTFLFANAISDALGPNFPTLRIGLVDYIDGEDIASPDGGRHPAFVKPRRFAAQDELRVAWMPAAPTRALDPHLIERSLAFRFCSPVAVL